MVYNCLFPFSSFISFRIYFLIVIFVFFIFLFLFYKSLVWKKNKYVALIGVLCLVGGATYNFGNRFSQGCVPDPLSFFGLFSFNYADLFVITGLLLLGSLYIMHTSPMKKDVSI